MIWSVTGQVEDEDLGMVLVHEHVVLDLGALVPEGHFLKPITLPGTEVMLPEVRDYIDQGGRTIVSLTNGAMGRDVMALREIAAQSGATIFASTGYYTRMTSPPVEDVDAVTEHFVSELTEGIDGSDVRAAVIGEIGTGAEMPTAFEHRSFEAAARAHLRTGAPIATHTHAGQYARWQLRYLTSLGVPANRVVIGHMDESLGVSDKRSPDLNLMLELVDSGAYVSVDTVGMSYFGEWISRPEPTDQDRAWGIARLVERGYQDHIVLGHDIGRPEDLRAKGGPGYTHIIQKFFPVLETFGVSRETAQRFLTENPRRWLTGK